MRLKCKQLLSMLGSPLALQCSLAAHLCLSIQGMLSTSGALLFPTSCRTIPRKWCPLLMLTSYETMLLSSEAIPDFYEKAIHFPIKLRYFDCQPIAMRGSCGRALNHYVTNAKNSIEIMCERSSYHPYVEGLAFSV